jgi:hypothetical protein
MFVIGGLILGAVTGGWTARRRGGKSADVALWAAVWAILFAILGLFLTLALDRLLLG